MFARRLNRCHGELYPYGSRLVVCVVFDPQIYHPKKPQCERSNHCAHAQLLFSTPKFKEKPCLTRKVCLAERR